MEQPWIREIKKAAAAVVREKDNNVDILGNIKPKFIRKEDRGVNLKSELNESTHDSRYMEIDSSTTESAPPVPVFFSEEDRKLVQKRYLGRSAVDSKDDSLDLDRRKQRRSAKLHFDWDPLDDTTAESSSPSSSLLPGEKNKNKNKMCLDSVVKAVDKFGNEITIKVGEGRAKEEEDLHWSEKPLHLMKDRDWRILKEDFGISVSGGGGGAIIQNPIRSWEEANFPSEVLRLIKENEYKDPTPIQRQAIPLIMSGRDVMGIAETGSGKTAAFILPIICKCLKLPPMNEQTMLDGPYALILAPTRELAIQIEQEANKFCRPLRIKCTSIVGGHSIAEQSVRMRKGIDIVIATPGRLRDGLEQRMLALNQVVCLVLDEADRMIDLNFEEDLNYILDQLPHERQKPDTEAACDPSRLLRSNSFYQLTMTSATMPPSIQKLAKSYLRKPAIINVGYGDKAAETVTQELILLKHVNEKDARLMDILSSSQYGPPIIIFVNQKITVDYLSRRLNALGHKCIALHGGKNQEQREGAIRQLRRQQADILIATDVAGRGIDIPNVSLVINYDMAKSIEEYIHRIGRTGRMGREGHSITLLTMEDSALFFDLRVTVQKAPKHVIPEEFLAQEASRIRPGTVVQRKRQEEKIYAHGV